MSRVLAMALIFPILTVAPGTGAEAGIADCAKISEPAERLACYDELSAAARRNSTGVGGNDNVPTSAPTRPVGSAPEGFVATGSGEWSIRNEAADDGSTVIELATFAKGTGGILDSSAGWPVLTVRCIDGSTFVYVNWNAVVDIGGSTTVIVDIKIDGETLKHHWSRYSDRRTTGLWSNSSSVSFLKKLFGKASLTTSLQSEYSAYSAQFDVTALEPAVAPIRRACDW